MIKSKRILSILLAVMLTVSCVLPVIALAAQDVYYSVSFRDENGNALGSEYQVLKGSTIDADKIPALPKSDVEGHEDYIYDGSRKHSSYSWDSDPATTEIIGNTVFTRVRTTEGCDYNLARPSFKFRDDNKNGVIAEYTCSKCGVTVDYGVNLDFKHISLSKGLPYEVVAGDGVLTSGYLDVSTIKTVVSALETVGVVPVGVAETINTIVDVVDRVGDVSDKIVEATNECARNGHLYGAPTYSWNDEHTECTAHFTCTRDSCQDYYENHVLDKKMVVQGPFYTYADCTTDGIETFTATTKFTDTNIGSVDGFDENYDFTASFSHVWQAKKGHKYTDPAPNGDATCTKDGTTTMVCENCGDRITNTAAGSALGHSPGAEIKENVVNPTCTQNGSYDAVRYCIRCGIEIEGSREHKTINKLGHTEPEDYVVENKNLASCTNGGSYDRVKYCSVCGDEISRETVNIAPTPHKGGEPVKENATEATCTEGGSYELVSYCTECGIEMPDTRTTVNVPKGDHDFEDVTTPATCTAPGKVERTCKVCGYHFTARYIDQLEHDYEETLVAPTCISNGYTLYTCSLCGDSYTDDETAQTDHHWNSGEVTVEPGCETVGIKTFTCRDCHTQRTEEIVAKQHKYSSQVIQPTCEKVGYTVTTCENCGETTYTDEVPAKGHTGAAPVRENEQPATCTAEGSFDSVIYCEDCGKELKRTPCVIPMKVHNSDRNTVNPTCTEQGYTVYTCKDCHVQFRASFKDPKGHHSVNDPAVPSTCVTHGKTAGSHCPDCGYVYVAQEELPLADHTWNSGVITTQPTTTETGVKTYSCRYCTAKRYETLPTISVEEATPTNAEANNAHTNKAIKKPANITTESHLNSGKMDIFFSKVPGAANYRVMYRAAGAKNWNYAWTNTQTHYVLTGLKKNGLYEFKFAAYEKNANGVWERGDYSQTSYRYYYKAKIKKAKAGKKSATVKWARDKSAAGYELFYYTKPDMSDRKRIYIKGNKKVTRKIKGLKKGKKYYVRVRSIKRKGGINYTSEFSNQKAVKAK